MKAKYIVWILFLYITLWRIITVCGLDPQRQDQWLWSDVDSRVNILRQHIHADKDRKWEENLKKLKQEIGMERWDTPKVTHINKQYNTMTFPSQRKQPIKKVTTTKCEGNTSETTLYVDMLNSLAETGGNLMELVERIRKAVELQGNPENLVKVDEAINRLVSRLHNVPLSLSLPKLREMDVITGLMERRLVDRLVKLIDSQPITSIVHVSCGNQMHWMNDVLQLRPQVRYMGLDKQDNTLVWLRSKYYGHPNIQFRTVEWQYMLPKGYQLLVAINALHPLELHHIYSFFSSAKYAGFEYILVNSYDGARNEERNQSQMLDFRKPPLGFKKPLRVFHKMGSLNGKPLSLLMYSKEVLEEFGRKDVTVTYEEL